MVTKVTCDLSPLNSVAGTCVGEGGSDIPDNIRSFQVLTAGCYIGIAPSNKMESLADLNITTCEANVINCVPGEKGCHVSPVSLILCHFSLNTNIFAY